MTTATPEKVIPATFLDVQTIMAAELPGYRRRPQQEALAALIELILATTGQEVPGTAMVQAGTGTGKSLGGAIPAVLHALHTPDGRVILVTSTIALMNQYINSDLPWLEEVFAKHDITFTWAQLKSIRNFVCLSKVNQSPNIASLPALVKELEDPEHTGDRDDIATPIRDNDWAQVSSTSEECPGSKCALYDACYGQQAKLKAAQSQIVVTSAAMYLTGVKLGMEIDQAAIDGPSYMNPIIGRHSGLIVDEAHEFGDVATSTLSNEVRQGGILSYLDQAVAFVNIQAGAEANAEEQRAKIERHMDAVGVVLSEAIGKEKQFPITQAWFAGNIEPFLNLGAELKAMHLLVHDTRVTKGDAATQGTRRERLLAMGGNALTQLMQIILAGDHEVARWAERYSVPKGFSNVIRWTLKTSPVDVSGILRSYVFEQVPTVAMSATMATGGGDDPFAYMRRSLGMDNAHTLDVGTPFDYKKQVLLYVPPADIAIPSGASLGDWQNWMTAAAYQLIQAAGGGAMLLFSSTRSMKATYASLADQLRMRDMTPLMQGADGTKKDIAERFRADTNSVLFGLKSFMVGVDFPGDTCRLVIIDKLMFPVPTDPIFAARSRAIEERGGSSFYGLSVPQMSLTLQQAYGRLIRNDTDSGVVAILDPRLEAKSYGKKILATLPPSDKTTDMEEVRAFYARRESGVV